MAELIDPDFSPQEVPMAKFTEEDVRERLKQVIDPELGVDVVNLGLIYGIDLIDREDGKTDVIITMTLTTFGCPLGPILTEEVNYALRDLPNLGTVDVNLVWSPPWTPDMMSEEAKDALGIW
ncbi:MAG: metal-sulfur cluster assembly factor [Thermomicrobium sp.]|nr:metal-sulfur cluster assembly factor [Thermomicrobium sp.]MDW8060069.1 metal-sulfur cluster assembly factor [Thermomicrobium sp.]